MENFVFQKNIHGHTKHGVIIDRNILRVAGDSFQKKYDKRPVRGKCIRYTLNKRDFPPQGFESLQISAINKNKGFLQDRPKKSVTK